MNAGVLVLNADRSPLAYVSWQRAVSLLLSTNDRGVPQARMFEADPERVVHSPSVSIPHPRIIELTNYLYLPFQRRPRLDVDDVATKHGVLSRDRYQCAYCGEADADTVDHVYPASRGGRLTWVNTVAACKPCNNAKGDRTPEEAGMRLRWQPWRPDLNGYLQRQVWAKQAQYELDAALAAASG